MERKDRNVKITARKPTDTDIAMYRLMNPGWNQGIEPLYTDIYKRRTKINTENMEKGNQSDVAMRIALNSTYGNENMSAKEHLNFIKDFVKMRRDSGASQELFDALKLSDGEIELFKKRDALAEGKPLDEMNNEELEELQRKDHESNMNGDFGERGNIHDINEDGHVDAFKGIDPGVLFRGKKPYKMVIHTEDMPSKTEYPFNEVSLRPIAVERNDVKGAYMGVCNMSSCKSGQPASWYNYGSLNYYCPGCAKRLSNDPFNKKDALRMFGHDLCLEGPEKTKE